MGSGVPITKPVVLERYAVQLNERSTVVHYIALDAMLTVCGTFVPPVPFATSPLIQGEGKSTDHPNDVCARCKGIVEKHSEAGRVVRLAHKKEGKYAPQEV